jgi:hypothetical protein
MIGASMGGVVRLSFLIAKDASASSWRHSVDSGGCRLRGFLPPEAGSLAFIKEGEAKSAKPRQPRQKKKHSTEG